MNHEKLKTLVDAHELVWQNSLSASSDALLPFQENSIEKQPAPEELSKLDKLLVDILTQTDNSEASTEDIEADDNKVILSRFIPISENFRVILDKEVGLNEQGRSYVKYGAWLAAPVVNEEPFPNVEFRNVIDLFSVDSRYAYLPGVVKDAIETLEAISTQSAA